MFFETDEKFIESFSEIKNKKSAVLVIQKCNHVLFQKHFIDTDYFDQFSRYERFCETSVIVNMRSSSPVAAIDDLP